MRALRHARPKDPALVVPVHLALSSSALLLVLLLLLLLLLPRARSFSCDGEVVAVVLAPPLPLLLLVEHACSASV